MERITVRHVEPNDYEALHEIFSGSRAISGTLQLPLRPPETWRRCLSEPSEDLHSLVACVGPEVVGRDIHPVAEKVSLLGHWASGVIDCRRFGQ